MLEQFEMEDQLPFVTFEGMEAIVPLLISEIRHDVGSSYSRHRAHPLTASVSAFMGPTNRLSTATQVLGCPLLGLQLFFSINPIAFRLNNHVMSIFRAMGFMWVSFGLVNSAETHL